MGTFNEVEIPLESIETALVQCAVPGFTGTLTVEVRLQPTAALEVELHTERKTVIPSDKVQRERADTPVIPSNDRVNKVRSRMAEVQSRLKVICTVTSIRAVFKDGHLVSLEIFEREQLDQPKFLPMPAARNTKVI